MDEIPRAALDAVIGTGRRPRAVLITLPDYDDPDLTIRGVTVLEPTTSGDGLAVMASILVLHGDTYMVDGGGGGVVLSEEDFRPGMTFESSPRPMDQEETEWLFPRIEVSFGPGGAVATRVMLRPADAGDEMS